MIPFPFQFGGFGSSLPSAAISAGTISFIQSVNPLIYPSTTNISGTTMSGILNDDGLFAIVMARSVVTPPAGWSLLKTITSTGGGATQYTQIYRKDTVTSANSSTSYTFTQASSGRGIVAYLQLRSSTGAMTVDIDASTGTNNSTSTNPATVTTAGATASVDNSMAIIVASLITTSVAAAEWSVSAPATRRNSLNVADNRLGIATQPLNVGESNVASMNFNNTGQYSAAVTVIIKAV